MSKSKKNEFQRSACLHQPMLGLWSTNRYQITSSVSIVRNLGVPVVFWTCFMRIEYL